MVGFTEAMAITGASTTVKPILQDLVVLCSGDDGMSVGGKAQPLIRSCDIRVSFLATGWCCMLCTPDILCLYVMLCCA
jgi:hypothetical protein